MSQSSPSLSSGAGSGKESGHGPKGTSSSTSKHRKGEDKGRGARDGKVSVRSRGTEGQEDGGQEEGGRGLGGEGSAEGALRVRRVRRGWVRRRGGVRRGPEGQEGRGQEEGP